MLNKKGFTISEVIVSFSLVTVMLASMVTATINYRNRVKEEEIITQLTDFKNNITKTIYDDILANKIVSVDKCVGMANCISFFDKDGNSYVLRIEEILASDDSHNIKRGAYLLYNNTKYLLPDSDLEATYTLSNGQDVRSRVCDFVGGFNIDYYNESNSSLYTVKTTFMHKDLDKQFDIILTITNYNENN